MLQNYACGVQAAMLETLQPTSALVLLPCYVKMCVNCYRSMRVANTKTCQPLTFVESNFHTKSELGRLTISSV